MNKLPYPSPKVMYLEIMTETILAESGDTNTIPSLDLFDLFEE